MMYGNFIGNSFKNKCRTYKERAPRDWSWQPPSEAKANRIRRLKNQRKGPLSAINAVYKRCAELKALGFRTLCVDHIVPLSKGGEHSADNLQIIYTHENCAKRDRLDYKVRVIFS